MIYKRAFPQETCGKNYWIKTKMQKSQFKLSEAQRGSIIVFTVLMLSAILAISLTLTSIFIPKIRSITEAADSIGAIYAADSAMEWCLYNNRGNAPSLPQPIMSNSATYQIHRNGTPSVCPSGETLNYRTVGTFRRVSRSFEISELTL